MFLCEIMVKKDYKIPKLRQNGQKIGKNKNFPEKLIKIGKIGTLSENRKK